MNFFEGDIEKLKEIHGDLGAAVVVRTLVHKHLKRVEERAAKRVEELDIELPTA